MGGTLLRLLAFMSSLLLALPPGWCCYVGQGDCCKRQAQSENATPSHRGGCCGPEQSAPEPTDPSPAPKPSKPGKAWCCERPPTAKPDSERHAPDLNALPTTPLADLTTFGSCDAVSTSHWPTTSSSRLHVLHCVWLC